MGDSREHILLTSFELFLKRSYKEVTMKEIVQASGLSKGAFYHYFESKEQLFEEIANHYFLKLMQVPYDSFSYDSLHAFYLDYARVVMEKAGELNEYGGLQDSNLYLLLFDAIKMIPAFKEKTMAAQAKELSAWKKIVGIARKNGEIRTPMTDEQVARMFIYISDGAGIKYLMEGNASKTEREILDIWEGIYTMLKT